MINFFKNNWGILAIVLLSFWAIKPLFIPGFFPMHDDTQVARVFEMGKMLKDGVFPVRWVPDLGYGYGYPIFNFYSPLAYYVGGFFNVLGFDALISTKLMMILGVLLSGVFMYLLAREFWGELGGIISGLFYVYSPYHAVDIYVRGDVAEFWAYAFIPLMFWGFYKVFKEANWQWAIVGAVGYAGVILSHNLTAMMMTPFLAIVVLFYCYIAYKNKNLHSIFYILYSAVLGLMFSAFYWIPALLEMQHTNVLSQIGGGADFRDHFVCLSQLWESNWGFGGSIPGCIDGLSFRIGKLHILSVVVAAIILALVLLHVIIRPNSKIKERNPVVTLSIIGFLISVFFMLEASKPVWEAIYPMSFFQYPWRFLLLASFFSSALAGFLICFFQSNFGKAKYFNTVPYLSVAALVFLLIFFNSKLFQPQTILLKTSSDYTNEYALKWTASKISDEFLPPNFKKPKSEREIPKGVTIPPQESLVQKIANTISLTGILIAAVGIIISSKKRLRA